MRNDIKFAGIASNWSYEYAKKYSNKLFEMGFYGKVLFQDNIAIVAYSHRQFSKLDAEELARAIIIAKTQ